MRRHDVDPVSLVSGAVFVSLVAVWLGTRLLDVDLPSLGWVAAGTLVVLGALGVVLAVRPGRAEETLNKEARP
jgi:hypothetical protein